MLYVEDFKQVCDAKTRIASLEKEISSLKKFNLDNEEIASTKAIMLEIEMLEYKVAILYGKVEEVVCFIKDCDDIIVSQAIEERFLKGKSWLQVAHTLGGSNTPESARKIVERYFKKKGIGRKEI